MSKKKAKKSIGELNKQFEDLKENRKPNKKSPEEYELIKLKREFLNKGMTIDMVSERMGYWNIYFLILLKEKFPNLTFESLIEEDHLSYAREWLYEDLKKVMAWEKEKITKFPKTQLNFYKLIYTR